MSVCLLIYLIESPATTQTIDYRPPGQNPKYLARRTHQNVSHDRSKVPASNPPLTGAILADYEDAPSFAPARHRSSGSTRARKVGRNYDAACRTKLLLYRTLAAAAGVSSSFPTTPPPQGLTLS